MKSKGEERGEWKFFEEYGASDPAE